MYGCENWTIKKAERQIIDTFQLWHWRKLLRVPWTSRRSNQSILKEISPEYSLEGLMLKLKCKYSGHLMRRTDLFEKTQESNQPPIKINKFILKKRKKEKKRSWCWERLKAEGEGEDRGWDSWMALPTRWTWVWVNSGSWWWTGRRGVLRSMGWQRVGHNWATELNGTNKYNKICVSPIHWKLQSSCVSWEKLQKA